MNLSAGVCLPRPRPFAGRALVLGCTVLSLALLAVAALGARDAEAAFPGTNGPIACSGPLQDPNPVSRLELFTMDDSGGMDVNGNPTSQVRLTTNFDSDFNPRYSADGRKIAFIRQTSALPGGSVWTMDADGTNERQLTAGAGGPAAGPGYSDTFVGGFSPDGSKIVFQRSVAPAGGAPRNFEVFTINVDGTGLTNLTNNSTAGANSDSQPSWSPDGTKIAFQSNRAGNPDIWVMNANGSNPVNLTAASTAEESAPEWSPDGTQIAFHSDRGFIPVPAGQGRNLEIYRMNAADGSNPVRLTFNPWVAGDPAGFSGFDLFPHWSPQGDRIVFHSGRGLEFNSGQWDVFTINSATGENPNGGQPARRLTRRDANDERCGWGVLTHRLTVTKAGAGGGTVTSDPPGIDCGADCSDIFKDALTVTLTATPGGVSRFLGFTGGGCSGTRRTCTVTMDQAQSVTATFGLPTYPLPQYPGPGGGGGGATLPFAGCPGGSTNVVLGTAGNDVRNGTVAGDRIFVGSGNDVVDGLAGDDCIDLGVGDDRAQGGLGNDLVLGGLGADRIAGSSGNDRLRGNAGNDRINGGLGNDTLHGFAGRDRVPGSRGRDRINGGSGRDTISGGSSGDRVAGDAGSDRINGNSGNDRLSGNSGNDRIRGGSGRDRIRAGSGRDRIAVRDGQVDRVNCGAGTDRVSADSSDIISGNCEIVSVAGASAASAATAAGSLGLPAAVGGAYVALLGWRRRRGGSGSA